MTPIIGKVYWVQPDSGKLYHAKCMSLVDSDRSIMRINHEYEFYTDYLVPNKRILTEVPQSWWRRLLGLTE